ncbi:PDZ domain-containing protein [uncultured Mameliella sp.]|uniref:PDZ domain-containing protein n=1 Tax=uncultured Mameliella sp. TaxID=1447087 RepID=UPI002623CD13|nr:PDZ domain-containing protein [uncultured Mameliella sp.]
MSRPKPNFPARSAAALALALSLCGPARAQDLMLFPPETFGQVVAPQTESLLSDMQLEARVGDYNNEFVANYGPDSVFARAGRPVGMLQVLTNVGHAPCTAFLVEGNMLVTNHHCIPGVLDHPKMKAQGASFIAAVQFHAGFLRDGRSDGVTSFHVNPEPIETNKELDYTVLQVLGDANATFGALELSAAVPADHTPFWVIGHPMGEAQRISREKCQADSPAVVDHRLHHLCDTLPGNSGSPVIDADSKQVVALHNAGSRAGEVNYAIPMADILAVSKVLKPVTPAAERPDDILTALQAERQKLADQLAALQAERDRLARELDRQPAPGPEKRPEGPTVPPVSPGAPSKEPDKPVVEKAPDPAPARGYMGIRIQDLSEEIVQALGLASEMGALVSAVPEGPSKTAGIKPGDVILTFGGATFTDTRHLVRLVSERQAGETIPLTVNRNGEELALRVTLTARPKPSKDVAEQPEPKPERDTGADAVILSMTLQAIGPKQRAEFGLPETKTGLFVADVAEESDAAVKGIQRGDVIAEIGQKRVTTLAAAQAAIKEARAQGRKTILLLVDRDGNPRFVALGL